MRVSMAFCQENRVTNLLEFLEYVTDAVDSGKPVDVIYLDFQKAFDKVPHARLLNLLLLLVCVSFTIIGQP